MKKVLVISDTHSYIDDRIIKYASEADYVIHAGDIGSFDVIRKLKSISKVLFVYGNIDGDEIRNQTVYEADVVKIDPGRDLALLKLRSTTNYFKIYSICRGSKFTVS